MIAGILAVITIVILIIQVQYYRNKAREFESLFELSKGYNVREYYTKKLAKEWSPKDEDIINAMKPKTINLGDIQPGQSVKVGVKLNKDGSIAKKRGRKPKASPRMTDQATEATLQMARRGSKKK